MEHTRAVILANGDFPTHAMPLTALCEASVIVCCDAAITHLIDHAATTTEKQQIQIVGDGDSLPKAIRDNLPYPVFNESEQEHNDLTKAMRWLLANTDAPLNISILGATGLREDHTLGNISLLMEYYEMLQRQRHGSSIAMISDYGTFTPFHGDRTFDTFPNQQVSIFTLTPDIPVTLHGLQYPLHQQRLTRWWQGSLNNALADTFSVSGGDMIVYQTHEAKQ